MCIRDSYNETRKDKKAVKPFMPSSPAKEVNIKLYVKINCFFSVHE